MTGRRIVAAVLVSTMIVTGGPGLVGPVGAQPVALPPPAPGDAQAGAPTDVTPARVSYINGEISFWRPGAADWTPAAVNMPLAPGDILYANPGGDVEVQIAPAAFVRATGGTQIALDNQEQDFVQLRMTGGEAAVDLRQLPEGLTVELDTPNAAFTIDRAGYYRIDVAQDTTTFATYRGGTAIVTPAGSGASPIAPDQQVVLAGTESPRIALGAAAPPTAWDNWNFQRTDYLLRPASARYVSAGIYGTESLDRYGSWRNVESYGTVWVPSGMPADWVPYSTGRWIWDPRFGWTWLDDHPWGWAPYHYGRWAFVSNYWAWVPGPVIVRPAYAPALVVFLGGVTIGVGRPLCWAPLAWGEPLIPWWGRPGFVGVPTWRGWGGPRVVNNVVINRNTTVNVTNITVYNNVTVNKAVVGVPTDRFGRGEVRPTRIAQAEVAQLKPLRGALDVKPVAASFAPAHNAAPKPPAALRERPVVATRAPHDVTPELRTHGLPAAPSPAPAPRLVPAPKQIAGPAPGRMAPGPQRPESRRDTPAVERPLPPGAPREAPPAAPSAPGGETPRRGRNVERSAPPPLPGSPRETPPPPPSTLPGPPPGQKQGRAIERAAPPSAPREAAPPTPPGAPGAEPRRGQATERPAPPPAPGAPGPSSAPNAAPSEPKRGRNVERPTPPTPPPPQPGAPEPRRGPAVERPTPPAPPAPTPRATAPERRPAPALERPAPAPREATPPPGPSGSNTERRRGPVVERQSPAPVQPATPPPASRSPEPRRAPAEPRAPVAQHPPSPRETEAKRAAPPAQAERPARAAAPNSERHQPDVRNERPDRKEQRAER